MRALTLATISQPYHTPHALQALAKLTLELDRIRLAEKARTEMEEKFRQQVLVFCCASLAESLADLFFSFDTPVYFILHICRVPIVGLALVCVSWQYPGAER